MKKIWKILVVVPIFIGIIIGVAISISNQLKNTEELQKLENVFALIQTKPASVTKFYTYGTSLNIEGSVPGIKKDNYEGARLLITDGKTTNEYKVDVTFDEKGLNFSTGNEINNAIVLDDLSQGKYFVNLRLKLNNSRNYKIYSLSNESTYPNIEYYTLTKNDTNNKINSSFTTQEYNEKKYKVLSLEVKEEKLPENIFDIVIDAACGGTDKGEKYGEYTESNLMLDYAITLKEKLEARGYKVKLTRDESNTASYTDTNMYDDDGRITIACKTKAKYMISLHLNSEKDPGGVEVYAPCKSNLNLAQKLASTIVSYTNIPYSSFKTYKQLDGVYVRNYTKQAIENTYNASKNYENYNLTTDTPTLYTIREVGGIATNAYVDGRNTNYAANKYYNSNQGIECYQIFLGSIKNNLNDLLNQKENYLNAIANCF